MYDTMDEDTERLMPVHLTNMNLATTPHHSFESADAMFVQAITIRKCAKDLQTKIDALYHQADTLEISGRDLQLQGMQQRQEMAEAMDIIVNRYKSALTTYTGAKLIEFEKLLLAVEEGRALMEQVEVFQERLKNCDKQLQQNSTNAEPLNEGLVDNECELSDLGLAYLADAELTKDGSDDGAYHSAVDDPDTVNSNHETVPPTESLDQEDKVQYTSEVEQSTSPGQLTEELTIIDSTNILEDGNYLFTPEAIRTAREQTEMHTFSSFDLNTARSKRKLDDIAEAEQQNSEGSDEVLSGRQKRQRKSHEKRKKRMLTGMGYDSDDISSMDLRDIITPQKSRTRKAKKSIKHSKRNAVPAKEARCIDDAMEDLE